MDELAVHAIGEAIKAWREAAGLTQNQLAKKCGISRGAIGYWELCKSSPPMHIAAMMESLAGIPMTEIMRKAAEALAVSN
jgi:transcriptional regulator with XRE-family HTH domain